MEREHVAAAQRWEYRRESMVQERAALLEQAMVAFHAVGREARTPGVFRSRLAGADAYAGAGSGAGARL